MSETLRNNDSWIDVTRLNRPETTIIKQPFPFLVAGEMLSPDIKPQLLADFPNMKGAGYLPYTDDECGPAVNNLIQQLTAAGFANGLGDALGIEQLSQYPTYVSISKKLNKRHGTIHTDGKSKIATMLLYLNDNWDDDSQGCLRFLNKIDDIEDTVVPEIPPHYGTMVAFKRTENSFHGHLPFEGERRVIQIAWLASAEDAARKAKRGKLSNGIKKLFGWLDKKVGSGRKDNAYND